MRFELPEIGAPVAAMLAEDLGVSPDVFAGPLTDPALLDRDVTSTAVVAPGARFEGVIVARQDAVVCGLPVADVVWATLSRAAGLDEPVEMFPLVAEGMRVSAGTPVAEVCGDARAVLAGERSALNAVMTLSGIASEAARWQAAVGDAVQVLDTRKTVPGLRGLSKYAVTVGGAFNHRAGLYDMVLVKDNHIRFAGGIECAVAAAREHAPDLRVEVEADTLEQAVAAARAGVDIVLLDNMDDAELGRAVHEVRRAAAEGGRTVLIEASGGIAFERLAAIAATGVDRVSTSALTLARPLDFGLDETNG